MIIAHFPQRYKVIKKFQKQRKETHRKSWNCLYIFRCFEVGCLSAKSPIYSVNGGNSFLYDSPCTTPQEVLAY